MRVDGKRVACRRERTAPRLGGRVLLAGLAVLAACLWTRPAQASWLLNQARFHASAHAGLSCADCHAAIVPGKDHPNPTDVSKPLEAFFTPDACLGCHGGVSAALAKGQHGGKPVDAGRDYARCIACHDPHTQVSAKLAGKLDRSRPVEAQCGACHQARTALPPVAKADAACMSCHREAALTDPGRRAAVDALCLRCHEVGKAPNAAARPAMPTMDKAALGAATHTSLACLDCHTDGARFPHGAQNRAACTTCHARHDEKVTHDLHATVSCEACHLSGSRPARGAATGLITARLDTAAPGALSVHAMKLPAGEASCARCHTPGNTLGASAMILPPKSVVCMPCHAATFSVADAASGVSLAVFLGGMVLLGVFWFSGAGLAPAARRERADGQESGHGAPASGAPASGVDWPGVWRTAAYDVFLLRGLYRQSPRRWAVHALIFYPFVFRFLWGMAGLLGSLLAPRAAWPWPLLDKNAPLGALLFDVSGLALLAGLILAALSWARGREDQDAAGLPGRDWPALALLLALTATGFVLEGMRIAMTGMPAGSEYAFAGRALALAFQTAPQAALSQAYGYAWHLHAVLTGLVVAYAPFSQLRHAFTAPLAMLLGALSRKH